MLPLAVVLLLATLAAVVLLIRRRRPAATPVVEPEPEPEPQPEPEAPKLRPAVLAEAVPAPARISGEVTRPRPLLVPPPRARSSRDDLDTLDALLAELESATVRIDGADAFDEGSVTELEGLAARLEAAAESLAAR